MKIGHDVCGLVRSGGTATTISVLQPKFGAAGAKEFTKVAERDLCPSVVPAYTMSQQSAIQDANSYLRSEPGFSKRGLVGQLEYDKFSSADAWFAVKHIKVNWMQQAVYSAQSYMQSEGGFSYGSLVGQLEYDKFTPAQAAHGAHKVGL